MKAFSQAPLTACNRRQALTLFAAGAGLAAFGTEMALAAPALAHGQPVTAYFLDGLVRDTSGRLPAYRAPRGFAGGRGLARMDETAMRMNGIDF